MRSVLLLLDSGACGADIMLHARAQRELGLTGSGLSQPQHHFMRGVGGESREVIKLEVGRAGQGGGSGFRVSEGFQGFTVYFHRVDVLVPRSSS